MDYETQDEIWRQRKRDNQLAEEISELRRRVSDLEMKLEMRIPQRFSDLEMKLEKLREERDEIRTT